jgi:hypothetical protein
MPVRDRVARHREALKARALVRVEVVVPEEFRDDVKAYVRRLMRRRTAGSIEAVRAKVDEAYRRFGAQCLDNIAVRPQRATLGEARVVANALMERGHRDAFLLGRELAGLIGGE